MRVKTFSRLLRILSTIVLFFFVWTFGPIWQAVAFAATKQKTDARGQRTDKNQSQRAAAGSKSTADKFEKALEDIRANVTRTEGKVTKGEDASSEIQALKAKKSEIETLDAELKGQFSATEKRLKDAKLPKEILDRHYAFIKHYENNVSTLKAEIDDIEKAKGKSDRTAKIQKVREHLEKVKPPKKIIPLDPNKLPHRTVKAKERAPRLKKEEFEKDFPSRKKAKKLASIKNTFAANTHELSRIKHKPIQLAFNDSGTFSDQPLSFRSDRLSASSSTSINDFIPQLALSDSTPILLAQATDAPTADDLAENGIEIQFTDDIKAKAAELGYSPVKIYEYVRNNIEFVPTYGSIQGADMCLQTKQCNDFDTASLLIALLRTSGISARYVYGTVEIPIEKVMNWVGGVTDYKMAGTVLATNGVPVTLMKTSAGVYKNVQMEHVYAKAFIDYIPSRGAVHKQGDTWIPLDPSYKQYTYTQGIDISSAVPFDAESFTNQITSTATINETEGYVTNVDSAYIQQTMQDYQTSVQNYITQNSPNATVGEVIGKKEIIKQEYPYLMGTLPYKTVQVGSEFAQVPDNLRETISFSIPDLTGAGAELSYITRMPQIAGKKITLSFSPATAADQTIIASYISTSGSLSAVPAYLVSVMPELRIDGQVVATGAPGTMGSEQSFTISLNEPGIGISNIDNIIKAGEYFGIGLDTGRIGTKRLDNIKANLESTLSNFAAQNYSNISKDDVVGEALSTTIATYFAELDVSDEILAKKLDVIRYRAPSIGMFSASLDVQAIFGIPKSASIKGMMMDVDRVMQAVFSKDGNMDQIKQYMSKSGVTSSALEHAVPEQLYSTAATPADSVSAIKAIQLANDQGIPIYTVNQGNIGSVLPQLSISRQVRDDVTNAVNAGKTVIVQKSNITYNGWNGCGYIIINPDTGAAAYMISSGMNGSYTPTYWSGLDTAMVLSSFTGIELNTGSSPSRVHEIMSK